MSLLPRTESAWRSPRLSAVTAFAGLALAGCGSSGDATPGSLGGAGNTAVGGTAGTPAAGAGSTSGAGGTATTTGGTASTTGGGASSSGAGGSSGTAGTPGHVHDHCIDGHLPHPSDSDPAMLDGPAEFYPPNNDDPAIVDLTLQPQVLQYMTENEWQGAHVEWHAIRGCGVPGGAGGGLSKVNICSFTQLVPENQNCQNAGDGYEFLVFHRHMMQALKQLWPNHQEQFEGFPKFPTSAEDVPPQWRSAWRDWDADALAAGKIGDEIQKPENLARFADEGELGFWLQCNVGQKLAGAANMPWVGLHFVLHAKWARPGNTTHGVNNTDANIDNYMFYKLHGWIDNVWENYRLAKGLTPDEPKLKEELVKQCREMDQYIQIIKENLDPGEVPDPNQPLPEESGFFHEQVRPIFESQTNLCSGCHAETGANAGLTLGGHVTSKKIVEGLVGKPSKNGGQYQLVVAGDPDRSWLYRKASGTAAQADCQASSSAQCITGVMPPSTGGPTVTAEQLQVLRQWILDGAEGPPEP